MLVANSKRLKYELMSVKDIDCLFKLDQDPAVMKYINGGKPPSMQEKLEVSIPRLESYSNLQKGWGLWKVTVIKTNEFIGWVLVRPMDFFTDNPQLTNLELGWRFSQNSWGQGYATEAAESLKSAIIINGNNNSDSNKVTKLSAIAFEENTGSINIMLKLGMTFVKKYFNKDPTGDKMVVYYELDIFN
jgi:RimJ/RimL family protein N-acetyltransferase